ncbi:hypothetical protein QVD17_33459 [Tagetes erecta]|uniref:Uncharacterized protein n=1 Tax=Tagetes erecta TaxID=13708 RepID=A0AAD8JXF5_TARER|nr:hypothetical protein QVD17_33459 [Tagetes erecta]
MHGPSVEELSDFSFLDVELQKRDSGRGNIVAPPPASSHGGAERKTYDSGTVVCIFTEEKRSLIGGIIVKCTERDIECDRN